MSTTDRPSTDTQTMTAYLCAKGADEAIAFYQDVFGATLHGEPWRDPADNRIGHSELHLGGTRFFLSDEYEPLGVLSPTTRGGTSVSFVVMVDDIDTVWAKAVERGAEVERDVKEDHACAGDALRSLGPAGHRQPLPDGSAR